MPAPCPASGFSSKASIATRQKSWRPALERSEKCWAGSAGNSMSELENWSQARPPKTMAAATTRTPRAAPRSLQHSRIAGQLERAARAAAAAALQPPQEGEEDEGGRRPGEQDEQHRDALVDGCLRGDVVGEAVVAGDREQRRQGAERRR